MQPEPTLVLPTNPQKEKIFTFVFVNLIVADSIIRISLYMLVALVPLYVLDRGFSPAVAGLTTTVFMLMSVLVRPASGKLADTRGRYIMIILGSAVYCLATGLFLFAMPAWLLLGARALQGLGLCFYGTATLTMATDIIPERRMSEGIGYLGLAQTVAQAVGPALALAVKNAYGYQVAFMAVFAVAAVNFLTRFSLKSVDQRHMPIRAGHGVYEHQGAQPHEVSRSSETLKKRSIWTNVIDQEAWKPSLIMFLIMFATTSIGTFLVAHATRSGIHNPGAFFTVAAVMMAVARLTVGKIHQRFGTAGVIAPGIAFICISLIGIYSSSASLPILLIAAAFYGLGLGVVQPEINSLAVLAAKKENRGLANSTFFVALDLSQAIAATVLGAIAGMTGLGSIFGISAGIAALTLLAYLVLRKRGFVQ